MTTTISQAWPVPFDVGGADRLLERFAALGRPEARLANQTEAVSLLRCLGGNSPYLSDLVLREPGVVVSFLSEGPDATVTPAMTALARVKPREKRAMVAAALRQAKRQVALV